MLRVTTTFPFLQVPELAFTEQLQRRMEATVLGLTSGSYAQRVQVRGRIGAVRLQWACRCMHTA